MKYFRKYSDKKPPFESIGSFIKAIEKIGELKVIDREVSWEIEMSRLTDSESKSPEGGKALLFARVKGSPFPAATNLFGSMKRICLALGVNDIDDLTSMVAEVIETAPPANMADLIRLVPKAMHLVRSFPRLTKSGRPPCQEVILTGSSVDLTKLPIMKCWPGDGGRFITLPLVFTRSLSSKSRNMGMYRMQLFDEKTTGMHWHVHKDGSHFFMEYARAKKRMPVSVAIGADPATIYAATAPLPRNVDELIFAGFIRKKPVRLTRCVTNDILVPAEAEFVIEGYVDPDELRREGPFGDHTGYYSLEDEYPVFRITAITHRKNPVYCATLVGPPPMEDCYLALATERLFLPLLKTIFPEIIDIWMPWEAVFHNGIIVSIDKRYQGQAQKLIYGLWGHGQMSFVKSIIVVDRGIDIRSKEALLSLLLNRIDLKSDVIIAKGVLDVLDHSSPTPNHGAKIGIDLTRRLPGESPRRGMDMIDMDAGTRRQRLLALSSSVMGIKAVYEPIFLHGTRLKNRVAFLNVERDGGKNGLYYATNIINAARDSGCNIFVLFDTDVDLEDTSKTAWKLFNNTDPLRDIHFGDAAVVVDACIKTMADGHLRRWPDELRF